MKQYMHLVNRALYGTEKNDRTGTGTVSIFGAQVRFHLPAGFPLLTTKKLFFRGVVEELLFFISGSTNLKDLDKSILSWWEPWADSNGNLGPIYSHQYRNFGGAYKNICQPKPEYPFNPININGEEVYATPTNKRFIILKKSARLTTIQFIDSGYIKTIESPKVFNRNHLDPYSLSVYATGYLEDPSLTKTEPELTRKWRNMLKRCYSKTYEHYPYYGGKGVFVVNRWLSLKNFIHDAKALPGFVEDLTALELDKDIIGNGFIYGPEHCVWCSPKDNKIAAQCYTEYKVSHKNKGAFTFKNSASFRKEHNIKNQGNFSAMLRGERANAEGFSLLESSNTRKGVDQLQNTIASIKTFPESRRHVISLWNACDIPFQALPCCHGTVIQFYVANGVLSCQVYQRSADLFLGVPINIASYALLTHMVAQQCNLEVGDLIWTGGDVHIYKNHIDQIEMQSQRELLPLPELEILRHPSSIFDYHFEDFKLHNYVAHDHIKGEISI